MSIFKSKSAAIGWTIEPCFIITLSVRDLELLNSIKDFFSVGSVSVVGKDARFRVRSRADLNVIIAHFNKYPLQTTKVINFVYFCEILNLINQKVHTSVSGLLKLASMVNKLNNPLSENLLTKLTMLGPLPNAEFEIPSNSLQKVESLNPYWISGFATGEGSFTYFARKRVNASGITVKDYSLVFEVSQRTQDLQILNLIASYLNAGSVYTDTKGISRYRLRMNKDNMALLFSFFDKYSLKGHKLLQYSVWAKALHFLNSEVKSDIKKERLSKLIDELSNLK